MKMNKFTCLNFEFYSISLFVFPVILLSLLYPCYGFDNPAIELSIENDGKKETFLPERYVFPLRNIVYGKEETPAIITEGKICIQVNNLAVKYLPLTCINYEPGKNRNVIFPGIFNNDNPFIDKENVRGPPEKFFTY